MIWTSEIIERIHPLFPTQRDNVTIDELPSFKPSNTSPKTIASGAPYPNTSVTGIVSIAGFGSSLTSQKLSAVDLIRSVVPIIGGKGGGGRPDFAQSGGSEAGKIAEAFQAAKEWFAK